MLMHVDIFYKLRIYQTVSKGREMSEDQEGYEK
jgi:hypothetical protein